MGSFVNAYGSVSAYTITLASLATDANLRSGRHATAVDYSALNCVDIHVTGRITSPASGSTAGVIEVWAYGNLDDTPTYPIGAAASDGALNPGSRDLIFAGFGGAYQRPLITITTDTTNARSYDFGPISLAQHFGGEVPKLGGLFVVHTAGATLHATAGNHFLKYRPVFKSY